MKIFKDFSSLISYKSTKFLCHSVVDGNLTKEDDTLWETLRQDILEQAHPAFILNVDGIKQCVKETLPWEKYLRMMSHALPEFALNRKMSERDFTDLFLMDNDFICVADAALKSFSDTGDQRKALMLLFSIVARRKEDSHLYRW